jgi:hypothetical protein
VLKYWWASAPIGYLAWHYWTERKKKGEANVGNLVHDLAPVVGVAVGLMMLNDTLARVEAASAAPAQPAFQAATDAQFTVQPKA